MQKLLKALAAAGLLAGTASIAGAAPMPVAPVDTGLSNGIVQVHGNHRTCMRGKRGWHRHNRYGERRECRPWRGGGKRPDVCVKVGPLWYCDY